MSERRACWVIGCVRMTVRYRSRRVDDAVGVSAVMGGAECLSSSASLANVERRSPSATIRCNSIGEYG